MCSQTMSRLKSNYFPPSKALFSFTRYYKAEAQRLYLSSFLSVNASIFLVTRPTVYIPICPILYFLEFYYQLQVLYTFWALKNWRSRVSICDTYIIGRISSNSDLISNVPKQCQLSARLVMVLPCSHIPEGMVLSDNRVNIGLTPGRT